MVDETDLWTPETGKTPVVVISKAGSAFVPLTGAPAVAELGSGWYKVVADPSDVSSLPVVFLATAAGCAQSDQVIYEI